MKYSSLSFQKIVLAAFGEWFEGEDRIQVGKLRGFVKVQDRIDSVQYSSVDNVGMMLNV